MGPRFFKDPSTKPVSVLAPLVDLDAQVDLGRASRLRHHESGPSSFENVPAGPFASRSASGTGSRAACWTVRVPWKVLRCVAVKPAHGALTWRLVDSRARAQANVTAFRP